ncbi:hypothetical protein AB0C65_31620 [Nocardia sp. NPDC048505]|uniref:hypothetical protein n=1 Tax=Nocardia sp. NPDC048505 TaxID=3155756 RepID=UPI0033FAFA0C
MLSVALLLLGGLQLACVFLLRGAGPPRWCLALVGLGLAYDSIVFGAGAALGTGEPLHALSVGRFVAHALLTPLLLLWAARQVFHWRWRWAWALTGALIAWGVFADLVHLDLVPKHYADTLRYAHAAPAGPPIPALVVSVVLLAAGILLWRRERWPWLALATVALLFASAAAFAVPPLGNLGEAVLFAALVAATRRRTG